MKVSLSLVHPGEAKLAVPAARTAEQGHKVESS